MRDNCNKWERNAKEMRKDEEEWKIRVLIVSSCI